MTRDNFCDGHGYLVNGVTEIPADLTEFHVTELAGVVGCNSLRCFVCNQVVRQQAGVAMGADPAVDALYETRALSQAAHAVSRPQARLYVCRCVWTVELLARALNSDEARLLPWRCAGHAPPQLPFAVEGVAFSRESAIASLVADALDGRMPGERPWHWLVHAYVRLARSSDAEALAGRLGNAIADAVRDGDPKRRAVALRFFHLLPFAAGGERLLELAGGDRLGLAGVENAYPEWTDQTLEGRLVLFVQQRALGGDQAAVDLLRREIAEQRHGAEIARYTLGLLEARADAAPPPVATATPTAIAATPSPWVQPPPDVVALVRKSLDSYGPLPIEKGDGGPVDSVVRYYRSLAAAQAAEVARAVALCLRDPHPMVRAQAVTFFEIFPDAAGNEELLKVARDAHELYRGVASPMMSSRDLEWQLLFAIAHRLLGDAEATAIARDAALNGRAEPVIAALSAVDADWVAAHAREIVVGDPLSPVAMIMNLPVRMREAAARQIAPVVPKDATYVAEVERFIEDPALREILLARAR